MSLIALNVPATLYAPILALLERLVVAVERIAGPEPAYRPLGQSTLADYAIVTPEEVIRVAEAEREFAAQNLVVPGSPAYLHAVQIFEQQVAEAYGDDAVEKLPWRTHAAPAATQPIPDIPDKT